VPCISCYNRIKIVVNENLVLRWFLLFILEYFVTLIFIYFIYIIGKRFLHFGRTEMNSATNNFIRATIGIILLKDLSVSSESFQRILMAQSDRYSADTQCSTNVIEPE
jgi:hypothetical protein